MRACAAVLIFSALPCFIQTESQMPRKILNSKGEKLRHLVSCVESFGVSKCVSAYGLWRAEKGLGNINGQTFFPWKNYSDLSSDEIYADLCNKTESLLQKRSLTMNIADDYSLQLGVSKNGSLNIDVIKEKDISTGRGSMKKMQKMIYKMLPLLLVPGLIMTAILPFFLPTLKMMTIGAGMLNNMALTGAIVTLLRNNAFNDSYKKKIIYINEGYDNEKYEPLENRPSEVVVDPFDGFNNGFETHDFRDYHLFDTNSQGNLGDSQWLSDIAKVKNVQILGEQDYLKNGIVKGKK